MEGESLDSIWEKEVQLPRFPQLEGDLSTDVLIIGGGLAGLLCCWKLTKEGISCTLIEQNRIMHGVSGRTTAKITSQHGMIYGNLLRNLGAEKAQMYWRANEEGLNDLRKIAETVPCDFQSQTSYLYQTDGIEKIEKEMAAYEQLGIPARWDTSPALPFPVAGAICFMDQGQFHPLKFASYVSAGLSIYENTKAIAFLGNRVQTPKGTITAKKIIVATHFPMLNKHGFYYLKLYQQRSYVIAMENPEKIDGMYLDCAENGLSVRSAGQWLLLGGGGHRTGKQGLGWKLPEMYAGNYFPSAKFVSRWATQDCMTLDGMPYIGQYGNSTPDIYVATGFQKWGMSTSMIAAKILTDLVQGKENIYAPLFAPGRSMMHKQLFINSMDALVNLVRPVKPRCPHLGCALRWNSAEHSWDCPCHGSRFSQDGKVLNNPATDDLKHPPSM